MLSVNKNPSVSEVRVFGLTMLGGFAALATLFSLFTDWAWSANGPHWLVVALAMLGISFVGVCTTSYRWGKSLYVVWMTGAMYMGTVMTTVILTIVFFVLLPIFSLIRLKDPLRLKFKSKGSYWEEYERHEATLDRLMRPF